MYDPLSASYMRDTMHPIHFFHPLSRENKEILSNEFYNLWNPGEIHVNPNGQLIVIPAHPIRHYLHWPRDMTINPVEAIARRPKTNRYDNDGWHRSDEFVGTIENFTQSPTPYTNPWAGNKGRIRRDDNDM
jgi:hypothetical protein